MIYILDTNILILRAKSPKFTLFFEEMYVEKNAILSISIVTVGEIESLMLQNNWGEKRQHFVQNLMNGLVKIDIHRQSIINAYAQIDAYSQGKLSDIPLPIGITARNMGKNDLWIAASAHATKATLLTTDKDFFHLKNKFIEIQYIDIQNFI